MEFKVLGNLKHDGIDYKLGDRIVLNEESAKPLLEDGILGLIEPIEEEKIEEKEEVKVEKKERKGSKKGK